jgi:hypothetical protein
VTRQTIWDNKNRALGYIEDTGGGKQRAIDARFRTLGTFDPRFNKTWDAHNRPVGDGNLLAALIFKGS